MSDKPVIFISHSSKDQELASVLQLQLATVFDVPTKQIFRSTDSQAIPSARDWFEEIRETLDKADSLVVVVSKYSMESIWVGYEIGYFWHKTGGKDFIYPLVMPQTEIQGPIQTLQYNTLENPDSLRAFFNNLSTNLNTGYPEKADIFTIVKSAADVTAENIKQILRDYLELEAVPRTWISYRKLDRELGFPTGTTEKYFPEIVPADWTIDENRRNSAGTALFPPISPSNPPNDPF